MPATPMKDTDSTSDDGKQTKNSAEEILPSDSQLVHSLLEGNFTKRVAAYASIIKKCSQKKSPDFKWSMLKKADLEQVVMLLLEDLQTEPSVEVMQSAVGMVGYIMSKPEFTKVLPIASIRRVAQSLLYIAKKEKDKKIVVRVLWGFAMEKYPSSIYEQYCDELVDTIIDALSDQESSVVIYESLRLLLFLNKSVGAFVVEKAVDFYPEVFPHLFHLAPKIRKLALNCTNLLLEQPDSLEVLSGIVKTAIPKIKTHYAKVLLSLVSDNCVDALIIWQVCIRMLDRQLHTGTTLINPLLSVIEKGFKSGESLIRVESFNCWHCLINNFALDESVLTSIKRLRLLVAPFTANNAKNEDIASAKLNAWWRLISAVGSTAILHFDLLVAPLLVFCFKFTPVSSVSPKVGGLAAKNLTMSGASSPGRLYTGMQSKLTHVFYHLLVGGNNSEANLLKGCSLDKLPSPVITNVQYTKHHELLHTCFREVLYNIASEGGNERVAHSLAQHLMKLLGEYVSSSNVKDGAEVVRQMFAIVSEAAASECAMENNIVRGGVVLEVMAAALCGDMALPASILSSRHYQAGSLGAGDLMRGTLASSLADMLLQPPVLLTSSANRSRFLEIWNSVLQSCKGDGVGRLSFMQGVCSSLSSCIAANGMDSNSGVDSPSRLGGRCGSKSIASLFASLWTALNSSLRFHINKTQTVDQGDSAEHDFGCMYAALTLPLQHCNVILKELPQDELRGLMEEWKLTYSMFVNLAPLSPAAPANEEADHLARQVTSLLKSDQLAGPPDLHCNTLTFVSSVLACISSHFRYSQLATLTTKGAMSPGKPRKKNSPLLELQSVVDGALEAWGRVLRVVGLQRRQSAVALVKVVQDVLGGVKLPKLLPPLLTALMDSMAAIVEVNPAARYGTEVEQKILFVYDMYCTLLEEHLVTRPLNDTLAPKFLALVQNGVTSTNSRVSARTRKLWHSSNHSRLTVPEPLQRALSETSLTPSEPMEDNWNSSATSPAAKGVRAVSGSFLNKGRVSTATSPAAPHTPAPRTPATAKATKPRAATSLLSMDDTDFVKISSPASNKKRILTPHQKEKLQERRCDIPALYSDLSQQYSQSVLSSQDMFPSDKESSKEGKKSHFKGEFSGRKSFTGTGSFPDMDGIEVMQEDAEVSTNNASGDIAEVVSDTDEKNDSRNIEDPDLSPSQLSFADRITKLRKTKKKNESETGLDAEKEKKGQQEDEDSEDEIPNSQVTDAAGPTKRVSSIFSSRTAEVLHNYSSPRSVPVSPANSSTLPPSTKRPRASETVEALPGKRLKKQPGSAEEGSTGDEGSTIESLDTSQSVEVVVDEVMETNEKDQLPSTIKCTPSKPKRKFPSDEVTPGKVTRSGRKIVAPNKGMPIPMTPPGGSSSKRPVNRPLSGVSEVNALNTTEENSEAVTNSSDDASKEIKSPACKSIQKTIIEMFQQTPPISDKGKDGATTVNEDDQENVHEVRKEKNPACYSRKTCGSLEDSDNDSVFEDLMSSDKPVSDKQSSEEDSVTKEKLDPPTDNENFGKGKSLNSRTKKRGKSSGTVESVAAGRTQTDSLSDQMEVEDVGSSNDKNTSVDNSEHDVSTSKSVVNNVLTNETKATEDTSGDQAQVKEYVKENGLGLSKSDAISQSDLEMPHKLVMEKVSEKTSESSVKTSVLTQESKSEIASNAPKVENKKQKCQVKRLQTDLNGVELVSGPRRASRSLKTSISKSRENSCDGTELSSSGTGNDEAVPTKQTELTSQSASQLENGQRNAQEMDRPAPVAAAAQDLDKTNAKSRRKKNKSLDVVMSTKVNVSKTTINGNVDDNNQVGTSELNNGEGIASETENNVQESVPVVEDNKEDEVMKGTGPELKKSNKEVSTILASDSATASPPPARTRGRKRKLEDEDVSVTVTKRRNTRSQPPPPTTEKDNDTAPKRPGRPPNKTKTEQGTKADITTTTTDRETAGETLTDNNMDDTLEVTPVKKSKKTDATFAEFTSPAEKSRTTSRKTRSPKTSVQSQNDDSTISQNESDSNVLQMSSSSNSVAEEDSSLEDLSCTDNEKVSDNIVITEDEVTQINKTSKRIISDNLEDEVQEDINEPSEITPANNRHSVQENDIVTEKSVVAEEYDSTDEDNSVENRDDVESTFEDNVFTAEITSAIIERPTEETDVEFGDPNSSMNDVLSSTPDEANEAAPMETDCEDTQTAHVQEEAPISSVESRSLSASLDSSLSSTPIDQDANDVLPEAATKPKEDDSSDLSITTTDSIDDSSSSSSASTVVAITPTHDTKDVSCAATPNDCNSPCITTSAAATSTGTTSSSSGGGLSLLSPCVTPSTSERRIKSGSSLGSGALRGGTSRAALMVACAQRNRQQNAVGGPKGTPARSTPGRSRLSLQSGEDTPLACDLLESPSRRSFSGLISAASPTSTPPSIRRTRLVDPASSERPWAKHLPSPSASPSSSILKRPLVDSCSKGRRVSFADPPVSESVVIPNDTPHHSSLQQHKSSGSLSLRAQKRLDMSRAVPSSSPSSLRVPAAGSPAAPSKLTKLVDPATLPQQPSQKSLAMLVTSDCPDGSDSESEPELDNLSCSQGIYSSLSGCSEPVTALLPQLTSPALTASLQAVLLNRGLSTVGHLANLTESDVTSLPIKPPKLEVMVQVLKQFDEAISKKATAATVEQPDEPMDEATTVDANPAEAVPSTSEAVPSTSEAVPSTSEAVPSTSEAVPSTSEAVLSTSEAVPSTSEAVPSTSEENLSDKENQSPPPAPAGSSSKSSTSTSSTSSSAAPGKKTIDHVKLFKRNLEPSAIREVLAEIPIGLDVEDSEEEEEADNLPLSALKNRMRSLVGKATTSQVVQPSTSGTQASQMSQKDGSVKALESIESTSSTSSQEEGSTDTLAAKDLESAEDELRERDVVVPAAAPVSDRSITEEQVLNYFRNLSEESNKEALLSQVLAHVSYKGVVKVFSEYLSKRE